jgi:hypothetical protein
MSSSHRAVRDDGRGFVLVGVAMFILVLTIVGLSLFSLSGFESQFMNKSMHYSQAFSAASGGLERARFALLATHRLESVQQDLPREGVIYARAVQGTDPNGADSSGTYDLNGDDIWVRVRARDGAGETELMAKFHPGTASEDYYKRLITARQLNVI